MAKKAGPGKVKKGPGGASKRRSAAVPSKNSKKKPSGSKPRYDGHFPIVGVGASAGGLEAFTELLKTLPDNPEMAFVFIQHMAPTHESMLPRLLSKSTAMQVVEVTDGMKVQPNHVDVIPPNAGMTITGGVLRLVARKEGAGKILPIDDFFWALAEDQKRAAIGVILSGTASDGTQGLKAIKAEGGITFAQDKRSARFADMPISAVASGSVDFILPPEGIAEELARMMRHPYIRAAEAELPHAAEGPDESLRRICLLLRTATGVDFHLYKPATIGRRVARRMAVQKASTREEYYQLLRGNRAEVDALYEDIFIHVTGFFRDAEPLLAMRGNLVASALDNQQGEHVIRVWVPGCSSGEEVYSIAMLLIEELGARPTQTRIQIFGTDISERAIEHARTGIYPEASMATVSAERRRRFFLRVESGYQIAKFVRDLCVFARHDVTKDPPFSKLDLISCRNVLIYLGPVLQKRVAETFHYALKPSGYLLLGKSESLNAHSNLFAMEDPRLKIFTRKQSAAPVYLSTAVAEYAKADRTGGQGHQQTPFDLRREAERTLLDQFVPAALVIDPDLQIVHFQGNTSRYLAPATGQPSFHVLRMVRPELVVDLRTAIHEAKKNKAPVRRSGIHLKQNGTLRSVDLQVTPLKGRHPKESDFLVVFQEASTAVPIEAERSTPSTGKGKGRESKQIEQLRRELSTAHAQLKTIIEEHEATSEEMTAVNEEIISSNEELQSTNEELETAKEELQSSNEELITLNDELQNRNAELGQLANDLSNLLVGVEIPIVILSNDLKIRRFTPVAEKALNLIATDVGRPFTDMAIPLNVTDWKELMTDVVENRRVVERDVQDREGRWHGLRIRPYQTGEHPVDGILMALFDIDTARRSLDEARAARDLSEAVVESVHEPLVILDSELRVVKATQTFYETFLMAASETEGRNFFTLSGGIWDVTGLRRQVEEILSRNTRVDDFEVVAEFPGLSWRHMFVNARRVHRQSDQPPLLLLSIQDATVRRETEDGQQQRAQVAQQSSAEAIVAAGADGRISMANPRAAEMFGYTTQELLGSPVERLVADSFRETYTRRRAEFVAGPQAGPIANGLELNGRRKDGTEFPVSITLSSVVSKDGLTVVDLICDLDERTETEKQLRISQERLALAQQGAGIGIWDWDTHSDRAACSRGWGPLHGLPPDDHTCTHDQWLALIHPEDRERIQDELDQALDGRKVYNTEMRVVWPDGSVHWLLCRGSVLRGPDRKPVRIVGVSVDITSRKKAEEERDKLTGRLAIAQDEERRRISRELHDDLTQRLAGLAMELGRLSTEFPAASERLKKRIHALQGRVVEAAETSRHVAYSLHPSELEDLGLAAALRAYCEDFGREGVTVQFTSRDLPETMSREVASCLYKITQEGLRNVVKHAQTPQAWVTLEGKTGKLILEVRDAGSGFPVQSLGASGGLGIVNMRERARSLKGKFSIESVRGAGTKITVEVPL